MKSEERKIIDDRFTVTDINVSGKYFKNVSRVHMNSRYGITMELDINTAIFPVEKGDSFLGIITRKTGEKNIYLPEELAKPSEKDDYDYVCYGTVFEIREEKDGVVVYASFGGLLMRLCADESVASGFRREANESRIYLMLKKA